MFKKPTPCHPSTNMNLSKRFICQGIIFIITTLFLVEGNLLAQHQSITGFGKETVVKNYPFDGIPLLQNFYFRFTDSDRHILVIEVNPGSPEADKITLGYFDDTRDDEYFYTIGHYAIPAPGVETAKIASTFGSEPRNACHRRVISKPGPDFTFILIGFSLRHSGEDHHIQRVSITEHERAEDESVVEICYNDIGLKNTVKIYEVEYAWVPNSFIHSTGESSGFVDDESGGDKRLINTHGRPLVIRGFDFYYGPCIHPEGHIGVGHHHLKEIGVLTPSPTTDAIAVYFSDRNQDDIFCWRVHWAMLNPMEIETSFNTFDRGHPPLDPDPTPGMDKHDHQTDESILTKPYFFGP